MSKEPIPEVDKNVEPNPQNENKSDSSNNLKIGLGIAAGAVVGAVSAQSFQEVEAVAAEIPSTEASTIAEETPETLSEETVEPFDSTPHSPELVNESELAQENHQPEDFYVHSTDEFGNSEVTHYSDPDGDGNFDEYEVYDSDGNVIEAGNIDGVSSENPLPDEPIGDNEIFYDPMDMEDVPSEENDINVMEDHENQPESGEYESIDWDAVDDGQMDEVAVNESTGADQDDVLAANDENPGTFDGFESPDDNESYVDDLSSNENDFNSVESGFDTNSDPAFDNTPEGFSAEDYGTEDYAADDYTADESVADDYAADDNAADDYSADDYGSMDYDTDADYSDDFNPGMDDSGC